MVFAGLAWNVGGGAYVLKGVWPKHGGGAVYGKGAWPCGWVWPKLGGGV